jgi:peptidoglycan/LPS O-acetylase OafA/YrhL
MAQRELYIDRLRVALTALVLLFHTAITYGGSGSWFYQEIPVSTSPTSVFFTLWNITDQAFFMGFFFLLAGYFTPRAYDRKGPLQFLHDRFLRLGVPLLFFCLVLGPLTVATRAAAEGHGFWPTILLLYRYKKFPNGPLWFAEALLIFSLAYCVWRVVTMRIQTPSTAGQALNPRPIPSPRAWMLSALGVGLGALLLRMAFPLNVRTIGLWLGYFASYIFLFALGIAAKRRDWLSRLTWRQARPSIIAACIAWPVLPIAYAIFNATGGNPNTTRPLAWPSILYAFWEPFVAWGIIAALLLWFRTHLNQPSPLWDWLSRRTYAVYILHTPILVAISLLLRTWHAPAIIKFSIAGILTCAVTWLAADPLLRLPGVRRIV